MIVILTLLISISSAFIIQRQNTEEPGRLTAAKEQMDKFEYDNRKLGLAVTEVKTSTSVRHTAGKPIFPEDKILQYVWVYIKLDNAGTSAVQVNPEEFTLSIPGKAAVKYDERSTHSMQKWLKATELNPGEQSIEKWQSGPN